MAKITTANARKELAPRGRPYFRNIGPELWLGYRKNEAGGKWVVRRYLGGRTKKAGGHWIGGRYASETIGIADDGGREADGEKVLNYNQARAKAEEHEAASAERARLAALGEPISVKNAVDEYVAAREERERAQRGEAGLKRDAASRLKKHAPVELMAKDLAQLSKGDLSKWRAGLGAMLSDGGVRRTVNDFKAALNAAARRHGEKLPAAFRDTIRDGLAAQTAAAAVPREAQVLPDADIRAIISATLKVDEEDGWQGDLARLVLALAATGARFSQISRLKVANVQAAQKRLLVPVSHKGRGTKAISHIKVSIGEDVLNALRPAMAGRIGAETLLLRPRWKQISPTKWEMIGRAPWGSASELSRPWAQVIAKAKLPADVVPYALRHSSIVRGLRAGLPVRLVAALHDTSSAMIEKHYAAYIIDALDELAARAVVPLITQTDNIVPLRGRGLVWSD
jgi:integrase